MKVDLLERLLDAGFTKDEIISLTRETPVKTEVTNDAEKIEHPAEPGPNDETKTGNQEQSTGGNVAEHQTETGTKTEPDNNPGTAFEDRFTGIEKRIDELIKTVHSSNLLNDSFGGMPDSLEDQTDKILACIIRPEMKGGKPV